MDLLNVTSEFLKHCKFEKNLSPKTTKAYEIDLKQVHRFLNEKGYSTLIKEISKIQIRDYLESISVLKPKSIRRKVATLKVLFNYLEVEDVITVSPFRKMRVKIKEAKQLPKVLDMSEVKNIFKSAYKLASLSGSCYNNEIFIRNIVIVELLFATGARVSEISNLKKDYIDLDRGFLTLRGKGNKERLIQICNSESISVLKSYYQLCERKIELSGGYFLTNRLGHKLSEQSIRNIVKSLGKKAEVNRPITPHVFRHTFATLLLEKDVDIKYIQLLLGHSSIVTTQIYTHVNRVKQREILRTKHPRKEFSLSYT